MEIAGGAKESDRGGIMKTRAFVAFTVLIAVGVAHAESWPSLKEYVRQCTLIVLCETEVEHDKLSFKVVEVWKGKYDLKDFNATHRETAPGPNYLPEGYASGRKSDPKQKRVFFFTG